MSPSARAHSPPSSQPQLHLRLDTVAAPGHPLDRPRTQKLLLTVSLAPQPSSAPSDAHARAARAQTIELVSVDLNSFSSPALVKATPHGQLPVKAVYKALVVGLRYLHIDPRAPVEFRRFQMRLTSEDEMTRFLSSIEAVCPVKPAAQGPTARAKGKEPASVARSSTLAVSSPAVPPSTQTAPPTARATFTIPALFPNLAASLQPPALPSPDPSPVAPSTKDLADLTPDDLDALIGEVLADEAFPALVEKVQQALVGKTR